MPTLIAVAFIEKTDTPFVWKCSSCEEVFALERMTPDLQRHRSTRLTLLSLSIADIIMRILGLSASVSTWRPRKSAQAVADRERRRPAYRIDTGMPFKRVPSPALSRPSVPDGVRIHACHSFAWPLQPAGNCFSGRHSGALEKPGFLSPVSVPEGF